MARQTYPITTTPKEGVVYLSILEFAKSREVVRATVDRWCNEHLIKGLYKDDTNHWKIPSDADRPAIPSWHFSNPSKNGESEESAYHPKKGSSKPPKPTKPPSRSKGTKKVKKPKKRLARS